MQFTPQQLAGGGKYGFKTKIGNWSEEKSLEEIMLQDFLRRKSKGDLLSLKERKRDLFVLSTVPHTFSVDGILKFGDTVMLGNKDTTAFLSNNIFDKTQVTSETYSVSAAPSGSASGSGPTARSTLVITKWPKYSYPDDVLRYGQPFVLACNPSLRIDATTGLLRPPLYLASRIVTTNRFAKMSNHQEVTMEGGKLHYDYTWVAQKVASRSYQPAGSPVLADDEIVLTHNATRAPLAANREFPMTTDFGSEYEVACNQYLARGKSLTMIKEAEGICTPDVRQRAELPQNRWFFRTADLPEDANDTRSFTSMTPEGVLKQIKTAILSRGVHGVRSIGRLFRIIDDRGNGILDKEEFRYGLQDFGISLLDEEFSTVMDAFDQNGDGVISFNEFLSAIADPPNDYRRSLISRAYANLDVNGDGKVTLADVRQIYDASSHPDVLAKKKTELEVLADFMSLWDTQNKDGIVTKSEFQQYYADISAGIDDDEYFANMIGAAWKL
jgi:calcyphosin